MSRLPPRLRSLRLLLPVLALGVVVVVLLGAGLLVVGQFTGEGGSAPSAGSCDAGTSSAGTVAPGPGEPTTADDLAPVQRAAAATIIATARGMATPPRAWVVALATAMQESRMGTLGMDVAVDHDSLGLFQQRPSQGWGTADQVRDPTYATRTFLTRLLAVPGWDEMPVTRAAQTVQRSAFPTAYARWEALATDLVGALAGGGAAADAVRDCTSRDAASLAVAAALPAGVVRTALGSALAESGKPYLWGGTGPDAFDCSGLVLRAYEDAGVIMPRTSREQYRAGAHVPVAAAQPGDLVFYAYDPSDPDTIHHVALYLGDGRLMEAQQRGVPLGVRPVAFTEAGLVSLATRPGTRVERAGNNSVASPVGTDRTN